MKIGTKIIHTGNEIDPYTNGLSIPIYQVSTYKQESVDKFGKYDYARSDNPTREALEETLALLENGSKGFAFASGMAAISSVLLLFSPGDHLIVCEDVYGGAYRVLTSLFSRLGISVTFTDTTDLANIKQAMQENTKGLYLETPSNPLMKITDLHGAAQLAKEKGIITIVDNTFMTPYYQRPLDLGCDIVVHSGTKFLGGHSDVICGFAVVKDANLGKKIKFIQNSFGAILGPQDSWLVLRGLKTLKIRMEESQKNALALAHWLKEQDRVLEIYYPGLTDHPGYSIHHKQSSGSGAVMSFKLETVELTKKVLEGVKLPAFAVSLGGVESIISYPTKMSHASIPPKERNAKGITDNLVRLSVGLEDIEDLIADLDHVING